MALLKKLAYAGGGLALGYLGWTVLGDAAEVRRNVGIGKGKTFLVLGAGFAGLAAAVELARLLPDSSNGDIVLIDEDNFLLFTPMLTEAAGGELDSRHILRSLQQVSKRIRFVQGTVTEIHLTEKTVTVQRGGQGSDLPAMQCAADHILIAVGSVTNFHGIPGLAETAIPMKKLEDASQVNERVLACLQEASSETDTARKRALLTFVVAGGGYTGVETMAAVNGLIRTRIHEYPTIAPRDVQTILINPGDRLLNEITPDLASYAADKLKQHGVQIRMKTEVSAATESHVEINGSERIPTRTLIWAAGVKPNPIVEPLPCEKGRHGGIKVDACCQVPGHPGIWAMGDCAEIPRPHDKGAYAPTAQNASREGKQVAHNIVASLHGLVPKAFNYTPLGELALVGRHSGVARVSGHNFSGPVAWAMWRAVYLFKMPGTGQKARILSDWVLDLIFGRDPIATNASNSAYKGEA